MIIATFGSSLSSLRKSYSDERVKNAYDFITNPKKISKIKTIDSKVTPTGGLFFNRDKYINSIIEGKPVVHINPDPDKAKLKGWKLSKDGNYYDSSGAMVVGDNYTFKKPTQPVIYKEAPDRTPLRQDPPTLNVIQPGYPVDMDLPELQQIQQNSITRGKPLFPGGPQTDYYTPIDRMGNVQEGPYKTYAMGGGIPGAVGFTYARTGSIPSNGPYAKKTKASAENGTEMKFYQEGLDWKPRSMDEGGVIDGVLDPILNAGKSAVNYFDNLIKTGINKLSAVNEPDPNIAIAAAEVESRKMKEKFMKERLAMESGLSKFGRLREDHPKTKKLESQSISSRNKFVND